MKFEHFWKVAEAGWQVCVTELPAGWGEEGADLLQTGVSSEWREWKQWEEE